jgi:hypothetical protein
MLGLGYDAKDSMSIAYVFLMGGAFASMWKARDKKNHKTGGPLIDYNLVMLTLPSAVSGSLFGVFSFKYLDHFKPLYIRFGNHNNVFDTIDVSSIQFILKAKNGPKSIKITRLNPSFNGPNLASGYR